MHLRKCSSLLRRFPLCVQQLQRRIACHSEKLAYPILCFIRENTVGFTAWIVSDVLQPCRFDSRRSSCSSRCLMKTVKPTWCLPSVCQVCDGWDADESGWRDERYSEQGVPPERIRIGLYAFENRLDRPILGCGLPRHADRIDGIPVLYPSAIPHLGARRIAVPGQGRRQVRAALAL